MFGVTAHQAAPPAKEYVQYQNVNFQDEVSRKYALEALILVRQLMQHHHAKRVKAQSNRALMRHRHAPVSGISRLRCWRSTCKHSLTCPTSFGNSGRIMAGVLMYCPILHDKSERIRDRLGFRRLTVGALSRGL